MVVSAALRTRSSLALAVAVLLAGCGGPSEAPAAAVRYDQEGRALDPVPRPASPPNLIVVVVDALRHDALPREGAVTVRMPAFAALAAQGVRFDEAAAPAPWTLPSIASLLTGLRPSRHGLNTERSHVSLPDVFTTYAEVLANTYGYDTAAFVAGPWFEGTGESVLQGFRHVEQGFALAGTRERVGAWSRRRTGRPFFLFLHTYEVHSPYGARNHPWPPPPKRNRVRISTVERPLPPPKEMVRIYFLDAERSEELRLDAGDRADRAVFDYLYNGYPKDPDPALAAELEAAYWDGARWFDDHLAASVAFLREAGLLDNTVLVITSDHGEAFGEHGVIGHGRSLQELLVRIPLVVVGPGPFAEPRRVAGSVSLLDVLPTFLDLAGMAPLPRTSGRSFLPALGSADVCRAVVSEERLTFENTIRDVDQVLVSARTPAWKYVLRFDARRGEVTEDLFDLAQDPGETADRLAGGGAAPDGLDACACRAIEALRDEVWRNQGSGRSDVAVPYASHPTGVSTPRPPPCDAPR